MSPGGVQGGSVSWFALGGHLCQLRPGVLCAVVQAAPIAGHALLFIHCLRCALQTQTSEPMCRPCCYIDVWLMRVDIWSCLSLVLEYKTAFGWAPVFKVMIKL